MSTGAPIDVAPGAPALAPAPVRPLRILVVANRYPPAAAGGYERITVQAVAAMRARGHQVEVLTTGADPWEPPIDDPPRSGIHRTLRWWWRDGAWPALGARERVAVEWASHRALRERLRRFRPDVVSWWAMGGLPLSLLETVRRAAIPAVGVIGDGWALYGPHHDLGGRSWNRAGLRQLRPLAGRAGLPVPGPIAPAARWLCISRWVRDIEGADPALAQVASIVHPGVDPAVFPPVAPEPWRGRLAVVGRVNEAKGVADAVRALALLPDATLNVDGPDAPRAAAEEEDRPEAAAVADLADELGVADRITWTRTAPDRVREVYAACDALVFPVRWPEPWGLVPLEAMAVGRPVIACATGGAAEYLRDGENALLVAPGQPEAIAAAVRRLAADPDLRARLVDGGRRTAATLSADAFDGAVLAWHEAEAGSAARPL
ncbi:glycosyl transferase group 1 [Patulibacter medicamentivorans]|uniref:Glycosyl transferase group 1 n=1 Tax=Patulibacter medicamentivorans TaxID=1097667 RepID=H0E1Z0_9ACTN|nr:glycosyltransferase family 4 protein [Patulibacter medicamentivorans]EHN12298.1 glycosyl transferase group 1 [Patulibacter medicamentivorans]